MPRALDRIHFDRKDAPTYSLTAKTLEQSLCVNRIRVFKMRKQSVNCAIALLLSLILSIALIAGCSSNNASVSSSEGISQSSPVEASNEDPSEEAPEEDKVDINEIPFKFVEEFAKLNSFNAVTEGKTTAVVIISTDQEISNQVIKSGDRYYSHAVSSGLITSEHSAYFSGEKVLYRDGDSGDYSKAVLIDYLEVYGTYPAMQSTIEGYIISKDSVALVELRENGEYKITLNIDKAVEYNKIQMKKMGNLSDYPVFSSVELYLKFDNNYQPITVRVSAKYTVPYSVFGLEITAECTQEYTVTYSNVNQTVSFPEESRFDEIA